MKLPEFRENVLQRITSLEESSKIIALNHENRLTKIEKGAIASMIGFVAFLSTIIGILIRLYLSMKGV